MSGGRPTILFGLGAPDGMTGTAAEERFASGRLHGISGITNALLAWLTERAHPLELIMFGSSQQIPDEIARRWRDETGADVLVNLICEPELHGLALRQLAGFERATQLPVLNPSSAVLATTRPLVARRLAGQAGVRVPHCTVHRAATGALAEHVEAQGHRYPVLLRPLGRHGSEGLVRVDGPDELAGAATGSQPPCTVTDFVDFRSDDGLWRKYRMVYAGGRLFRRHVLTDRAWNLTRAARAFMGEHPELVAQEREWLQRPVTLEPGGIEARILAQFRTLQLDFGVIDFALPPGGDLVVFEINACVQLINRADARAVADRRYFEANNDEILEALVSNICGRAAAPAQLRDPSGG